MEENEVMREIIPIEEEYNFRFDNGTCDYIRTGICPVDEMKYEIMNSSEIESHCKCVRLIHSIIHKGFVEYNQEAWIVVTTNDVTGLYEIINGRHRICAASKMKVPIKVHFNEE